MWDVQLDFVQQFKTVRQLEGVVFKAEEENT
jgi:hypothetical protein